MTRGIGALAMLLAALLAGSARAEDGEGSARIVEPDRLVAGSRARVIVELTIGPSGIPVGGGVSFGLHHAALWPGIQTTDPEAPNYLAVEGPVPDNFETAWHEWIPAEALQESAATGYSDSICHQVALAKVIREPLAPGARVRFILGANDHRAQVQPSMDPGHEFHIMTDANGDGVYRGIAEQLRLDIIAGPAHHLIASGPATVVTGEPFEVLVRAEDAHYNLADAFSGAVDLVDMEGETLATGLALKKGLARIEIAVDRPGAHRLAPRAPGLPGTGAPCRAFDQAPPLWLFWGDIHGHTSISDGLGADAAEYFAFGREVAGLDVCALTDHGHFDWPQTIAAVKRFYEPGRYVTILAQEAGAACDHMNYYFRHDETPHVREWTNDYGRLYEILREQYNSGDEPEVFTGPHHYSYDRGDDRYPFGLWDDRTARFVEVYSSHGASEFLGNPRPCHGAKDERKFMQYGLAQGHRFGVIASSDCHDSHPGRTIWGHYPGGLVGILAPELTREAIWQAIWNRHTYAASFDRIYLEFTINGQPMGSEISAAGPCRIQYYVIGMDDRLKVSLIRNNIVTKVDTTTTGVIDQTFEETPPDGPAFYYLRIEQENGERAWSSPIWLDPPEPGRQ